MIDLEYILTILVICILLFIALVISAVLVFGIISAVKCLLNFLSECIHQFICGYKEKKDVE